MTTDVHPNKSMSALPDTGSAAAPASGPVRHHVLACATVLEEMLPFIPAGVSYEVLDFGLHLRPGNLKAVLQERIDQLDGQADVILLGYGLCSLAVVGLVARSARLVVPRVDDCIAIFLGSRDAYREQASREPGTYYFTKGWIEVGDSPFNEHQALIERYGEARAERLTRLTLKHYKRICFINTGHGDLSRYHTYARTQAERFGLRFETVEGSPALVVKLLTGPWDSDFVVAEPGQVITYAMFASADPA